MSVCGQLCEEFPIFQFHASHNHLVKIFVIACMSSLLAFGPAEANIRAVLRLGSLSAMKVRREDADHSHRF